MHLCPKLAWHLHVPLDEEQVLGHGASSGEPSCTFRRSTRDTFSTMNVTQRWLVLFLAAFIDIRLFTALFFK
jgi:hypothetical protein